MSYIDFGASNHKVPSISFTNAKNIVEIMST